MQIRSYTPRFSMPLEARSGAARTNAGTDKAPAKEDFSSHFSGPDDVTVTHLAGGGIQYGMLSPSMRLSQQWERWREQLDEDPDENLPDSTGWTEENIAYLKQRFSGKLTWVEREDALETMRKLGMISGNQHSIAQGGGMVVGEAACRRGFRDLLDKMVADVQNPTNPLERDWNVLFRGTPIVDFRTIDDVLNWAKKLPDDSFDPLRLKITGTIE